MTTIALFALIGAAIHGGVVYWICFAAFCVANAISMIIKTLAMLDE